jgi:hypothetical protein
MEYRREVGVPEKVAWMRGNLLENVLPLQRVISRFYTFHRKFLWAVGTALGLSSVQSCVPERAASRVIAPTDMPDICRDIDFNAADAGLKKDCGVETRSYKAYRNIPEHRNLVLPKNGSIVLKDEKLELRLEGFLAAELHTELKDKIEFGEHIRRISLKSRFDYFEYFPPKATQAERLFKLDIPLRDSTFQSVCFFVERSRSLAQRKIGYASRLIPLNCPEFDRRKAAYMLSMQAETPPTPVVVDSSKNQSDTTVSEEKVISKKVDMKPTKLRKKRRP